jgi:hypothetical protein
MAEQTIETFRTIGGYELSSLTQKEPTCFNGKVRVRKTRITVELIDEPIEVIQERIQKLWDENKNHHNWGPLVSIGKEYNLELK